MWSTKERDLIIEYGEDPDRAYRLENSTEVLFNVHLYDQCLGRYCTIHNYSDHSMRSMSQHWRVDRGIMERLCPHGIGHPDPDNNWARGSAEWVHGCDGCCRQE